MVLEESDMNILIRAAVAGLLATASVAVLAAPRTLDRQNSRIEFAVKQMGVEVSGRFERFDAQIDLDSSDPAASSATVTVDIASLTTGDADADEIALDKPWLDRAGFPKATFTSSSVRSTGSDRFEAIGMLEIRGKSRGITVPFETREQADGSTLVTGGFSVRRSDFGIGGGEWNEGDLVANDVPVRFSLHLAAP
jgi:polyisoprenoid-binding protein YceI